MCSNLQTKEHHLKSVGGVQYDGDPQTIARATCVYGNRNVTENNGSGDETLIKKRKTRRGKPKRRNPNPYVRGTWQQRKNLNNRQAQFNRKYRSKIIAHGQALAPYNSNQFLMEDHGNLQELDDKLNKSDGAGSSLMPSRTRDSSFSVDSDADFYSSPEDEEEFLTKEFDNAYEDLHAERLQSMTKAELIEEYLQLESKVELLTKRLRVKSTNVIGNEEDGVQDSVPSENTFQQEINKLLLENDELRRENEHLRSGVCRSATSLSSSVDSESDSSSSTTCNSSTSSDPVEVKNVEISPSSSVNCETTTDTNGLPPHPSSPTVV